MAPLQANMGSSKHAKLRSENIYTHWCGGLVVWLTQNKLPSYTANLECIILTYIKSEK